MNHWVFVAAAYAATLIGVAGLMLWSWTAMRRAEAGLERIGRGT